MNNYLPLAIRKILAQTGWSENELITYSSLLERGGMGLSTISEETGIPVSSLQHTLKGLLAKNMIKRSLNNRRPVYIIDDIKQLNRWTKGFLKQYVGFEKMVGKYIENANFKSFLFPSKVRFYEGYKGVKLSYRDILMDSENETEMYSFFSVIEDVQKDLQKFFIKEYVPNRLSKNIRIKNIAAMTPKAIAYRKRDADELRETKLISKKHFPVLNTEINLYGDYVHCMSFDKNNAFAIILKDAQLAAILKSIFSLLWTSKNLHEEVMFLEDHMMDVQGLTTHDQKLFPSNLKEQWISAKPKYIQTYDKETIVEILGHKVGCSKEEKKYELLKNLVSKNSGNALTVGYGLGAPNFDSEQHFLIELNKHLAKKGKKNPKLSVLEGDWRELLPKIKGVQFKVIFYNGSPLMSEEMNRDFMIFIESIVKNNLLTLEGMLSFRIDNPKILGPRLKQYLAKLGLKLTEHLSEDGSLLPLLQYKQDI